MGKSALFQFSWVKIETHPGCLLGASCNVCDLAVQGVNVCVSDCVGCWNN